MLYVKQIISRVKYCSILFYFYRHRLYFKSLSSGETEKEKYFLVLQVSSYFSIPSLEEFFHIYSYVASVGGIYNHRAWRVVLNTDFCKRSGSLQVPIFTQTSQFLALFLSRKVALWFMDDLRTGRTTRRKNRGNGDLGYPSMAFAGEFRRERWGWGVEYSYPFRVLETGLRETVQRRLPNLKLRIGDQIAYQ